MLFSLQDQSGKKIRVDTMLRIGRDPQNDVVLPDAKVSRFHAVLSVQNGTLMVHDEGSSNGTFVNQNPITETVSLKPGDQITIGDAIFTVESGQKGGALPTEAPIPPAPPVPQIPQIIQTPQIPMPVINAVPRQKPVKKGIIWPLYVILFFMVVCALIPIFGAIYYKAPQSEKNKILMLFGKGPGTIQVENFGDDTVFVFTTTKLDYVKGDGTYPVFEWTVSSFGMNDIKNQDSGLYRIDFGTQEGDNDLGSCTINLRGGDIYHFMVLPGDILIDRTTTRNPKGDTPSSVAELDVATSSLCKQGSH